MPQKPSFCGLSRVTDEPCERAAAYWIVARTNKERQVVLFLCHEHIHRAWHLSQALAIKRFRDEELKIRSIRLHQVAAKGSVAQAAS